ncbi:unnamed protein product [Prorocentrum cordatum]|uniref:Uncharacterized protein n=1 Tax=Prorocentrum cordatum TaxID=2364126 RepID=A0ABN9WXK3_9DINO|nr:unnamed protein product [Polarella glacialis]
MILLQSSFVTSCEGGLLAFQSRPKFRPPELSRPVPGVTGLLPFGSRAPQALFGRTASPRPPRRACSECSRASSLNSVVPHSHLPPGHHTCACACVVLCALVRPLRLALSGWALLVLCFPPPFLPVLSLVLPRPSSSPSGWSAPLLPLPGHCWLPTYRYSPLLQARDVLQLGAIVYVPVLLVTPLLEEATVLSQVSWKRQFEILAEFSENSNVRAVFVFVLAMQGVGSPIDSGAMFFFYTDKLNFTAKFLGAVTVSGNVGSVLGIVVYHTLLRHFQIRPMLAILTLVNATVAAVSLIQVLRLNLDFGVDDHIFTLVHTFFTRLVAEMLFIAAVVLSAHLCAKSIEGTTLALFISVSNFGHMQAGLSSAGLTAVLDITRDNLDNLWVLSLLCCTSMLVALPLVPFLPVLDSEPKDFTSASRGRVISG